MEGLNLRQHKLKIFAAVAIAAAIFNPDYFFGLCGRIISALSPVFIGMTLSFVLNRPICRICDFYRKISDQRIKKQHNVVSSFYIRARTKVVSQGERRNRTWIYAVVTGYVILALVMVGIIWIIVPQLTESVKMLYKNMDLYHEKFLYYYRLVESRDTMGILPVVKDAFQKLSSSIPDIIAGAYKQTTNLVGVIVNFAIGLVISIYILADKDKICSGVKKLFKAFATDEVYNKAAEYYHLIYKVFLQFVSGQLTEAVILGVLCFIGMVVLRFDYALLISTIIGITALIPVVGAIVGTIPCAFLLFLVNPMSAVWFVVFIIILQQLENNLIYPKVVGKSMGLPSLPVLIAILAGAKFGGAVGILLAVPLTAVVYGIIKEKIK